MFNNARGIVALLVLAVCYGIVGHNDYQETVLHASEQAVLRGWDCLHPNQNAFRMAQLSLPLAA